MQLLRHIQTDLGWNYKQWRCWSNCPFFKSLDFK